MRLALAAVGVNETIRVARSELSTGIDTAPGIDLTFALREAHSFRGPPILSEMVLTIASDCEDADGNPSSEYPIGEALPYGLQADDSQEAVLRRLGRPLESEDDEDCVWDEWKISGQVVVVYYSEDKLGITQIEIKLPD